jgi:DNA-binding response OmpR family regulator
MALILIVDDAADIVETIETCLIENGYQVMWASNGYQALEMVHCQRPDLVLLEFALHIIGGIEVCRQLRADSTTASLPILFMSTRDSIECKTAAFEVGADDYLVKPFDLQELLLRVRALLIRKQSAYFGSDKFVK